MLVVAIALGVTACSSDKEERNPAPDFELEALRNQDYARGELVSLSQFEGQPVVLNFWYPSCPPCRLEIPHIEAAFQTHKADGVQFLGIQIPSFDTAEDGQVFIDEQGVTYPVLIDPDLKVGLAYRLIVPPHTVFIDKDHEIARAWTGVLTTEKIQELLQEHGLIQ